MSTYCYSEILGTTETIVQIIFWLSMIIVAWKTYFAARDNLKNPVFTEYQKKRISSMQTASLLLEEYLGLPKQFDFHTDQRKKIFDYVRSVVIDDKTTSLSVYDSEEYRVLSKIFVSISADPFVPEKIESRFHDFCNKRIEFLRYIFQQYPSIYLSQNKFSTHDRIDEYCKNLFSEIDQLEKNKNQTPTDLMKVAMDIKLVIKQEMRASIPNRLLKSFR